MTESLHNDPARWSAKHDVYREATDFADLLKIVACYYEMYSKAATFIGPYLAKQFDKTIFFPPDKDLLKAAIGKERPAMSFQARSAFIESVIAHMMRHKGKKTLITPNPSSHHSAQFPTGTFEITKIATSPILRDDKGPRHPRNQLHCIRFSGADKPLYIEDLKIPPEQIKFVILRPKLGKLGTPSTTRWEILLFKHNHGYLIDHVDSNLNPRWSGIM